MVIVLIIIHVKKRLNVSNKSKYQDYFHIVLLLSCFVGHPVAKNGMFRLLTVFSAKESYRLLMFLI